jgi:hypothetical protein
MTDQFDELTKGMAQSVTRRGALKKFGLGLAGIALACFGLPNKAHARQCLDTHCANAVKKSCASLYKRNSDLWDACVRDNLTVCYKPCDEPF